MINEHYNEKFRKFFEKFFLQLSQCDSPEEKDFLWKLCVQFVEKNRDFVMQYPLVHYWEKVDIKEHTEKKSLFLHEYSNKEINLYFHIPFCKTKCTYCNFHIVVWDKNKSTSQKIYLQKLKKEIDDFLLYATDFSIKSIFIWWWTPSYLDEEYLQDFLSYINKKLGKYFKSDIEYSFEWNPDSLSFAKLEILKNNQVNRLSLGVQTFENDIIKKINRTYQKDTVIDVLENAKKAWFKDINIDMIYGLPWSNYENMKRDLDIVSKLDITHVTYYPLYYYEESILSKTGNAYDNIDLIYKFYHEVTQTLKNAWYWQYGREYFAKNWLIHNYQNNFVSNWLLYWFWHSAYSFNGKYAFYKEQNLQTYMLTDTPIEKYYQYNEQDFTRRLFVLWSRNINIEKVNIKNIDWVANLIKICKEIWMLTETQTQYKLTDFWLKYQEIFAHFFV